MAREALLAVALLVKGRVQLGALAPVGRARVGLDRPGPRGAVRLAQARHPGPRLVRVSRPVALRPGRTSLYRPQSYGLPGRVAKRADRWP